jgi:hypothetical protein
MKILLMMVLSKVWRDWRSELILVRPEAVIRWRERKFREFWRRKSQNRPGRPTIPNEHIDFIRRISSDHPEYGEDRIALESDTPRVAGGLMSGAASKAVTQFNRSSR